MPEASYSDSSARGCRTNLLLVVDMPEGSETGSEEGRTWEVSVAGGTGAV